MKKAFVLIFIILFFSRVNAQVGIGTTSPAASAALEIMDSAQGLLIPRMTLAQRQAIINPARGLLVYQTNHAKGLWCFNGSAWSDFSNSGVIDTSHFAFEVRSGTGYLVAVYTNSHAYVYVDSWHPNTPWHPIALTGTPLGAAANNNAVVIYTSTAAFAFTLFDNWSVQPLSGTPLGLTSTNNMMVVSTSANLYGYAQPEVDGNGPYQWYTQPVTETPLGSLTGVSADGVQGKYITVYTSSYGYVLARRDFLPPQWYAQALQGGLIGSSVARGGQVVLYTATNAYGFPGPQFEWVPMTLPGRVEGIYP